MQRDTLTQEPYRSEVRPQQEEDTIDLLELCMGLLDPVSYTHLDVYKRQLSY